MEIRNAPNSTAALSFVEFTEAARYVFVLVAAAGVMVAGRRYDTIVLAYLMGSTCVRAHSMALLWCVHNSSPLASVLVAQQPTMRTRPTISRPGHTVAAKLGSSEICLGLRGVFWPRDGHFGGFTYDTQSGVICITMAVALWGFSLVGNLWWSVSCHCIGELRTKRTQTSAAALTRCKGVCCPVVANSV